MYVAGQKDGRRYHTNGEEEDDDMEYSRHAFELLVRATRMYGIIGGQYISFYEVVRMP